MDSAHASGPKISRQAKPAGLEMTTMGVMSRKIGRANCGDCDEVGGTEYETSLLFVIFEGSTRPLLFVISRERKRLRNLGTALEMTIVLGG
ncbi:MAG: hypothetical protein ACE5IR_14090 [bacterium]